MRDTIGQPFAAILYAVTEALRYTAVPLKGSEATMYRMNRDVRFSNDKPPYNAQVSGVLTHSGRKAETHGLSYVHLDARGAVAACGFYNLAPKALAPIRERIVDRPSAFSEAATQIQKAGFDLSRDDVLTAMPQGYAQHADAPFARDFKLKPLIVRINLTKAAWTSGRFVDDVARMTRACTGLLTFGATASKA